MLKKCMRTVSLLLICLAMAGCAAVSVRDTADDGRAIALRAGGPGSSTWFYDTASTDGFVFRVTYGDRTAEYSVSVSDGGMLYDRTCSDMSGEVLFQYSAWLDGNDYQSMTAMLTDLTGSPDGGGEAWTLSCRLGDEAFALSGDLTEDGYGGRLYMIREWLNAFETAHDNLYAA